MTTSRAKYVALGDSTGVGIGAEDGRGYVHRIASALDAGEGIALANLCVSGATAADVLEQQVPRMEKFRAAATEGALFTLLVGVNDLWRGGAPGSFGQTYASIVSRMQKVGGERARIFVASLPDMRHAPAAFVVEATLGVSRLTIATRVLAFNDEIERVAKASGATYVNLAKESLEGRDALFSADGFHPSSAGYERLAQIFLSVIRERAAHDGSRSAECA